VHYKKKEAGFTKRFDLLYPVFPDIQRHLGIKPHGVGKDDLVGAASAAWTALRRHRGEAGCVCKPECDENGLGAAISY
jgi:hypothetical protein